MKNFKNLKNYTFLLSLIITTLLFTIIGYIGKKNIYEDYSVELMKTPQLAVVFEGIGKGNYPWAIATYHKEPKNDSTYDMASNDTTGNAINSNDSRNESNAKETNNRTDIKNNQVDVPLDKSDKNSKDNDTTNTKKETAHNTQKNTHKDKGSNKQISSNNSNSNNSSTKHDSNINKNATKDKALDNSSSQSADNEKNSSNNHSNSDTKQPDTKQNTQTYTFKTVSKNYFNDALFIGDSRTVGLQDYSGWKNPTYYADVGLTIYDVFDQKIASVDGRKVTIEQALTKKHFKKIYIMLGINELGRGNTKTFIAEYKKVIQRIQKLQPSAIIFVEGIMNVAKEKSDKDPIFNNKNIKEKNDHLALLADNKDLFYIDVNEVITDKHNNIPAEYTFDNIHLKAMYYKLWTAFLLKHGVTKD